MKSKLNKNQVIICPHLSEKATQLVQGGQYVFQVHPKVNKLEIEKAVRRIFKVEPVSVRIISVPAKKRRLGRSEGRRPGYKKAIVQLKGGESIELV